MLVGYISNKKRFLETQRLKVAFYPTNSLSCLIFKRKDLLPVPNHKKSGVYHLKYQMTVMHATWNRQLNPSKPESRSTLQHENRKLGLNLIFPNN